jgi:hypothetical protein
MGTMLIASPSYITLLIGAATPLDGYIDSCVTDDILVALLTSGGNHAIRSPTQPRLWTLRVGLGLTPILAGLDKYFNLLTNWEMYLNPLIPRLLHISVPAFMHIAGAVEIVAGLLVFSRFTRYAAYIVMAWLLAIAASLVTQGLFLDIAVRDVEISFGAFVLAKLTEVRQLALRDDALNGEHTTSEPKTVQRFA